MVKNPSSSVVSIEIRILSLYPAPLEALDLLTKWYTVCNVCVLSQRMILLIAIVKRFICYLCFYWQV